MFTLYARKGAGSAAVEALLAQVNAPFDLVEVPRNPDRTIPEWFFKINPRGEVPTLKLTDDSLMTESAAMLIYLADLFPNSELAPPPTSVARAHYLRWIAYLATGPYQADLRMLFPERYSTDPSHAAAISAQAQKDLDRDFAMLDTQMGQGPYLLGSAMSAADIYAAMLFTWTIDVKALFFRHPKLGRLYEAVSTHPQIRKIWDRNEMP